MRLIVAGLVCGTAAVTAGGGQWPQWRGPNRDGSAVASPPLIDALPQQGLAAKWVSGTIGSAFEGAWSSPVIADGKVYLYTHSRRNLTGQPEPPRKYPWLPPDKRGHLNPEQYEEYEVQRRNEDEAIGRMYGYIESLLCLDLMTGEQLYSIDTPSVYTRFLHSGTATVIGDRAWVIGAPFTVRCFDLKERKAAWSTKLDVPFRDEYAMSSVLVANGVAVATAGSIVGLDAATGELLWQKKGDEYGEWASSPVAWRHGDKTYVLVNTGNFTLCLDPRTGEERWRVESFGGASTPVLVGEDRLITYGQSRKRGLRCYRITPQAAEELWVYQGASDFGSSPVVTNGHVYVQGGRTLACVDLATGQETWRHLMPYRVPEYTSLIAADGKVFYACEGLLCFAADPLEYRPLYEGKMDKAGLLASEARQRQLLGIADPQGADAVREADNLFERQIVHQGPMRAASPAIADGLIVVRRNNDLACWDLRKPITTSRRPDQSSGR